jgi:hypothetical protein
VGVRHGILGRDGTPKKTGDNKKREKGEEGRPWKVDKVKERGTFEKEK